jgi:predicted transcriptional regulator
VSDQAIIGVISKWSRIGLEDYLDFSGNTGNTADEERRCVFTQSRGLKLMVSHEMDVSKNGDLLKLASDIVAAYVSNNPVPVSELPAMIKSVHATLGSLSGAGGGEIVTSQKPAVPVKKSVTPEFLICLEDGKKLKMLKRYLRSRYTLTPDQYRAKWNLPADYPMVASNYAAQRSEFAKKIGLGRSAPAAKGRRRG